MRRTDLLPQLRRLRLPLLVAALAVAVYVHNFVAARVADGVAAIPSADEVTAKAQSAAPIMNSVAQRDAGITNTASRQTKGRARLQSEVVGSSPTAVHSNAESAWGVTGDGRAFVQYRSDTGPIREHRMFLHPPDSGMWAR